MVECVRYYSEERPHSALKYLRPVDDHRANAGTLRGERHRKVREATASRLLKISFEVLAVSSEKLLTESGTKISGVVNLKYVSFEAKLNSLARQKVVNRRIELISSKYRYIILVAPFVQN